jgi:4-carboxymuconolactone decarboxylase
MRQRIGLAMVFALVVTIDAVHGQTRPAQPRIEPLAESQWSAEARAAIAPFLSNGGATNLLKTLAHHPASISGIFPFARYIQDGSTLPPRDRSLLALRATALGRADAIWAEQASLARRAGVTETELRRIAAGPEAPGWSPWEAALLRAADELYRNAFISDAIWTALSERYNTQQLLDVVFTIAESEMLASLANSFGVQPDAAYRDRIPGDVPRVVRSERARPVRLPKARLTPIPREEWSEEVRTLLDPGKTGRPVINLYMTLARHPAMYRPRALQSAYIRSGGTLTPRVRELLILRIGWLSASEYEWAQHVRGGRAAGITDEEIRGIAIGPGWSGWDPFEAALLRATDEMYAQDMITDATWRTLAERYDVRQLIDVVITATGYRMVSVALNTLGVQLEPDREGFPDLTVPAKSR